MKATDKQVNYCIDIATELKLSVPCDSKGIQIFETSIEEADKFIKKYKHKMPIQYNWSDKITPDMIGGK